MEQNEIGKIYFVRSGLDGPIKIGFTRKEPYYRIRELQTAHPEKLFLLATAVGTVADEKMFHKRFLPYQLHGEWFRPAPELINYIYPLPDIEITPEALPIDLDNEISAFERSYLEKALASTSGNMKTAAKLLKIDYRSMRYRVEKHKDYWNEIGVDIKKLK